MILWTTIAAILIFLLIIWILVALLLFARRKLVPEGKVKININGEREIEHERGCSLLQALSDEKVFVPSACGGGGSCGTCKGKVLAGGGQILPTELAHISRKMAAEHYRLFCQVKVREDMRIEIPKEFFGIKKWTCKVVSNHNVATFIKELVLELISNPAAMCRSTSRVAWSIMLTSRWMSLSAATGRKWASLI